jgi:hypothetical protein
MGKSNANYKLFVEITNFSPAQAVFPGFFDEIRTLIQQTQ